MFQCSNSVVIKVSKINIKRLCLDKLLYLITTVPNIISRVRHHTIKFKKLYIILNL